MLKKRIALLALVGLLGLASCGSEMEYVAGTESSTSNMNRQPFEEEVIDGLIVEANKNLDEPSSEYNSSSDNFANYTEKLNNFSGNITSQLLANIEHNSAISPLSIYMALAMTSSISANDTKNEILNVLDMTDTEIKNCVSALIYYSNSNNNETLTRILANSIWLNSNLEYENDSLTELASYYGANAYSADFSNDNNTANNNVTKYVRNNTRGLINQKFELGTDTAFALINALYYKDAWEGISIGLELTLDNYTFTDSQGNGRDIKLIEGNYVDGRAITKDTYSAFYAETLNDYRITFIKPNDNYNLSDVFTADTISYVNSAAFKDEIAETLYDSNSNTYNMTRCLFPTFRSEYKGNIIDGLYNLGITKAFNDGADFSNLTDTATKISKVIHATKLKVDTEGVEGAAVTVAGGETTSIEPQNPITYYDFVVDRAFGYVISDSNGVPLFTGIINEL